MFFPLVFFAQDSKMRTEDFLINAVLENTANYFVNKKQKRITPFRIKIYKKDTLEWDKFSLSKWQIPLRQDSLN